MLTQKFIRENGLKAITEAPYFVEAKEYDDGLVTFNYNQIESPKYDPMVSECRGLILDAKNDWAIVARSFKRFYNYGECPKTKEFNISTGTIEEKIDGSLITVYHHNGAWHAATRKMAKAEGLTSFGTTFREIFDKAFDLSLIQKHEPVVNYVFELISPYTRVVTPYPETEVRLLTVLDRDTGYEYNQNAINRIAYELGVLRPKSYKMNSFDDMMVSMKELNALDEGYVCVWELGEGNKHRIKVKNPSYLAIAHMRENGIISEKRVITLVMANDEEEYLQYFNEDRPIFEPYQTAFKSIIEDIHRLWAETKEIEVQKTFALRVKDTPLSGFLFNLRKGISIDKSIEKMSDNTKIELFKKYMK